jgi:NADH-quinone oxidoreductase subunit H
VTAEYTGWRLAIFRLARVLLIVTVAAAVTVFYLGGWLGPALPPWAWSGVKILSVATVMLIAGRYVPRVREEHLLAWWWKYGIPLALFNIFYVGVLLLVV